MFKEIPEIPRTLWTIVRHALSDVKHHPVKGTLRFPLHLCRGLPLGFKRHTTIGQLPVLKSERFWQQNNPTTHTSPAVMEATVTHTLIDSINSHHWSGFRGAQLSGKGNIFRVGPWRLCGIVRKHIPVIPGQTYQIALGTHNATGLSELCCVIQDAAQNDLSSPWEENQLPIPNYEGSDSLRRIPFRTLSSCTSINIYLILRHCNIGEGLNIKQFSLEQINLLPPAPALVSQEKIIASLATIPERKHWLQDTIMSLLPQVDEIRVYLNGYTTTPEFLHGNDKIHIEHSPEGENRGDAGKFFWADDRTPGYRFICDDDIVYPLDYVSRMIARLQQYNHKVILGAHGILLKQPLTNYYAPHARHTISCRDLNPYDHSCHLLGTGALAYYSKTLQLSPADFATPNMADAWFSKAAHAQHIPLVCISHVENWLMMRTATSIPNIYDHSADNHTSGLNTAQQQTDILQSMYPLSIPAASNSLPRKKVLLAIKTFNRLPYLKDCLRSFQRTCSRDVDWVIIIADDGSTDGTLDSLDTLELPFETHIIRNKRRYAVGQCNSIVDLAMHIGFDFGFMVDDDLVFMQAGWDKGYLEAAEQSGYDHLCFLDHRHYRELQQRNNPAFEMPSPHYTTSQHCEAYIPVEQCMGALFTFTPKMINTVGQADEENFPVRGHWHIDLSMRACRAGLNNAEYFYDIANSNTYLTLQNNLEDSLYRYSIPWNTPEYENVRASDEVARRNAVLHDASRIYLPPRPVK